MFCSNWFRFVLLNGSRLFLLVDRGRRCSAGGAPSLAGDGMPRRSSGSPWPAAHAVTIGSSSAGAAPWRITPSAPRSNWRWTASTQRSGVPVAAGASHTSGMSVATCSSSAVVAFSSIAPWKLATIGSARKRASGAGSQRFVSPSGRRRPAGRSPCGRRSSSAAQPRGGGRRSWPGRTTPSRRRVASDALGGVLHRADAALQRLVGEERVQDHPVEHPAAEPQRVRPERREPSGMSSSNAGSRRRNG